ncbi:multicopper oxidase family protein [Microvirga terricola]|uniref:Multicopper oxidase family protein n=1 Tax=Microvirga terricola TaxID=2719797 RepID=A0ABX0VCM3_9HYPH|nr:multicopper oxidase family protein [Microvirga terricola]NIX77422.1 multicopper oxidase family protein [Microvirga terricola]
MITRRAATAGLATTLIGLTGRTGAQVSPGPIQTVTAKPTAMRLRPNAAKEANVWAFDGQLSRVFSVRHGADLRLSLKNETPLLLSLHFHGVRGPNAMDGVGGLTQRPVAPGESFFYTFAPPDPGTFLIRPCVLGGSAEPLERGLFGLLIVKEPNPPLVDRDIALVIDDWSLTEDGALAPFDPAPLTGRLGNWLSVTGKAPPQRIEAPQGARLRLRLANACNARAMRLRFDELKPSVIAIDGQPTETFEPLRGSLPFAPGNRYDLLVDLPMEAGAKGAIVAAIGDGIPLAEFLTTREKLPTRPDIAPLPPNKNLPDAIKLQSAARQDVVIKDAPTGWTVNGAPGDASGAPLLKVKRGSPVVLALVNQSAFIQPMHLHGHVFRLLHPFDDGWDPYFLDTVQVPENRTIRIAFVADNPGKWLLASTVMERFDAGLWTWIEVT